MLHDLDFFHRLEPESVHSAHRRRKALFRAVILVVVILVVCLAALGFFFVRTSAAVLDGRDALIRARDAVLEMDFGKAVLEIDRASASLNRAESGAVILQTVEWVPFVGERVRVSASMLRSGWEIVRTLSQLADIGAELIRISGLSESEVSETFDDVALTMTFDALPSETKRAVLRRMSTAADDFASIYTSLVLAEAELDDVLDDPFVGSYLAMLNPWRARIAETRLLVETMTIASRILPQFLGLDQEKETLLLFLNNEELRPGGGFIGTYGILSMKDGEIVSIRTKDAYYLDRAAEPFLKNVPPAPLRKYLTSSNWFFRDANWSPDFALSAKKAVELWNTEARLVPYAEQPRTFANVAGFTPTFISSLLEITGPLRVAGQTFTSENMADRLEYQVERGFTSQGIPEGQRKEIFADLVRLLKTKMYALPLARWGDVLTAAKEAFRTKQFALYSEDQTTENLLSLVGWGGRVLPKTTDAQMVVDANLASLKSDPVVSRSARYEVFRNTDKQFVGRTTIRYEHHGGFDWKTTRYRTYTRLLVPQGSRMIRVVGSLTDDALRNPSRSRGEADVSSELGLESFGAFTSVEPGQMQELSFEYFLAPDVVKSIEDGHYRLSWIKQVGAREFPLTLVLDFDKNVTFAAPAETAESWGDGVYSLETIVDQDRVFAVEL